MGYEFIQHGKAEIKGYEAMNMKRKGQIQGVSKGAVRERVQFVNQIFGVVA